MNKFKYILGIATLVCSQAIAQIPQPAGEQTKPILIYGAKAHIGNGEVIENSFILIDNGKITSIGDVRNVRLDKTGRDYYDASGQHAYPGFILPNTTLGLAEISAIRATRDYVEVGSITPNARAIVAYNAESKVTATVRTNGILMGQITPRGGMLSGTSSIVEFDGWNWEDAVYKMDDGVHLNWPSKFSYSGWWTDTPGVKANENYGKRLDEIRAILIEAKAYANKKNPLMDVKLESLRGLFDGTKQLFVHVEGAKEIMQAVVLFEELEVQKQVLVGAGESYKVLDFLLEHNTAVILQRVHTMPSSADEDVDLPYRLPGILHNAGVLVALDYSGDMERMGARNLPFTAGTAAAYGMDQEEALKLITSNTAKILGLPNVGTLEGGKEATLFLSEGNALDMRTNNVTHAWIRGRKLDLSNHQAELYERYKKKYGL
jgi:imidazolonepropionase-like amidohydrolase